MSLLGEVFKEYKTWSGGLKGMHFETLPHPLHVKISYFHIIYLQSPTRSSLMVNLALVFYPERGLRQ